ncbi:MAG: hypothetical protein M3N39_05510, partial [Pseudomonadota bacterium]|nr:hypothetical protein [Pseudomonadota bacterium]
VRTGKALRDGPLGLAAGRTRYLVEADVLHLIGGRHGIPSRVTYLADVPNDASGKPAKLRKKTQHIVFAAPVPSRPQELRLVASDAQLAYSNERAERVRAILQEAMRPGAAPRIAGIGRAFHVQGSIPGESETQIFLLAEDGRPVSLSVLRRPGETPSWSFALTEIVHEASQAPSSDSLLWYRLACGLPQILPHQSFADVSPAEVSSIKADYRVVREGLGPCSRSRRAG